MAMLTFQTPSWEAKRRTPMTLDLVPVPFALCLHHVNHHLQKWLVTILAISHMQRGVPFVFRSGGQTAITAGVDILIVSYPFSSVTMPLSETMAAIHW